MPTTGLRINVCISDAKKKIPNELININTMHAMNTYIVGTIYDEQLWLCVVKCFLRNNI